MENAVCRSCQRPKANLICGVCEGAVCKKCTQNLKADTFTFLTHIPAELTHRNYCPFCYDEKVAPALESYERTLRKAKAVFVFLKTKGEETRLFSRSEKPLQVRDCPDREEAILRLAFLAAEKDCNTIIDVDIRSEKVRNQAYQTMKWHITGVPSRVDPKRLKED
jgi:hypothetical protein